MAEPQRFRKKPDARRAEASGEARKGLTRLPDKDAHDA